MDPIAFEIEIERLTRLDDLWKRLVVFARDCGVARIGYHHLPPPGAPDAGQQRIENDGFSGPLLAQYLEARTSGIAVLASALQNSVRPVYLEDLDLMAPAGTRERASISSAYRAAGVDERPRRAGLRSQGAQRHLRHRPRPGDAAAGARGDGVPALGLPGDASALLRAARCASWARCRSSPRARRRC